MTPDNQKICEQFIPFAVAMANKFPGDREELRGAAMLGLCRAAHTFDPARGVLLATHARRFVLWAIWDHLVGEAKYRSHESPVSSLTADDVDDFFSATSKQDSPVTAAEKSEAVRNIKDRIGRGAKPNKRAKDGMRSMDIAERLGVTRSAASQRISRAWKHIQEMERENSCVVNLN